MMSIEGHPCPRSARPGPESLNAYKELRPTMVACAVVALLAAPLGVLAQSSSGGVVPGAVASVNPAETNGAFARRAPPGFSGSTQAGPDRVLLWRGLSRSDIVWVEKAEKAGTFVLAPSSISAFRTLLLDAGFDGEAIRDYLGYSSLDLNRQNCLALAAKPQACVNVSLRAEGASNLELVADDQDAQLVPNLTSDELSLVGSSYAYMGGSRTAGDARATSSRSQSLGFTTRGVLSKASTRLEYDMAAVSTDTTASGQTDRNQVRINTLAGGTPLGDGMAFGGVFRAASGGQAFGLGAQDFFAKPALAGFAWQSDNADLSSSARTRRVLVQLPAAAFVRVLYDGVQLFEGNLAAGSQWVSFTGFASAFVDVIVRDSSGRETTTTAEVQTDIDPETAPVGRIEGERSLWYADVGQVLDDSADRKGLSLKLTGALQATLSYSYLGDAQAFQVGAQYVNGLLRAGGSVSDRDNRWKISFMFGAGGELGYRIGLSPRFGGLRLGLNFTEYRPPQTFGVVNSACSASGLSFCLSGHPLGYQSAGLSFGMRGVPVSFVSQYARSAAASTLLHTITGAFPLNGFARGANFTSSASYAPKTNSKSVNLTVSLPLDRVESGSVIANTGVSANLEGSLQLYAGVSRTFDPQQEEHLRSVAASAQYAAPSAGPRSTAITAQANSQLGPVANSTSVSTDNKGNTSVNTSFSAHYGVSPAGLAFAGESQSVSTTSLFAGQSGAGVTVINRSQEEQTVKIQGRETVLPPNSNVLIPINQGFVRGVTVSPGPVASADDARAGRLLHKGNIKSITINDGFWVVAKFFEDNGVARLPGQKPLQVEFTYKRPGEAVERLYASPSGDAVLFEFKENGEFIERFISVTDSKNEYRCVANSADIPAPGELSSYKEMQYRCKALPAGGPLKADMPPVRPGIAASSASNGLAVVLSSKVVKTPAEAQKAKQAAVYLNP